MFVHLSIHHPQPGQEQDLIDSMHRFGRRRGKPPACGRSTPCKDQRSGRLVGLALWEDEAAWRAGVEAMRAAVAEDPFEEWELQDPDGFALEEV